MSEPCLILHKVRGQPAFDIAERMTVGSEEWWIIPTSGHRAYPYQHWRLEDVFDVPHEGDLAWNYAMPLDWPDHYPVTKSPHTPDPSGSLAQRLGLVPKAPVITRRL